MKMTTLNTNGLENERFRELTSNELTAAQGGSGTVIHADISIQKSTDRSGSDLYSSL
jgi:hypothetical protein